MPPQRPSLALAQPAPAPCRVRVGGDDAHRRLLADEAIGRGERILRVVGVKVRRPDRYSIQIGPRTHLTAPPDVPPHVAVAEYGWRFLNHSCDPTACLHGLELVAIADIPEGGEITFDYNTTEWDMASPFSCLCGAPSCVGLVRGYRHLDAATRTRILPWTAEHLRLRA